MLFILYSKLRQETLCFLVTYCIFSTSWVQNTERMFHIGIRLIQNVQKISENIS